VPCTHVSVQFHVHHMVKSEMGYVSCMNATGTFPELTLVINTKLLRVFIYVSIGYFSNWTDTVYSTKSCTR
jgi:hypothetical protein